MVHGDIVNPSVVFLLELRFPNAKEPRDFFSMYVQCQTLLIVCGWCMQFFIQKFLEEKRIVRTL